MDDAAIEKLFDGLRDDVRGLGKDVKALSTEQAATTATLDVVSKQNDAQIGALFQVVRDQEKRVTGIEVRYWPRDEQQRFEDKVRERLGGITHDVTSFRVSLGRSLGIATAVLVVGQIALAAWLKG